MSSADKTGMLIATLLLARDITHREHLKTRSYAQHMALGDFYTGMQNANNQQARLADGRKDMLGASYHKPSGKWISRVKTNGKDKYLGLFDTPEQANQAYLNAKREIVKDLSLTVELL